MKVFLLIDIQNDFVPGGRLAGTAAVHRLSQANGQQRPLRGSQSYQYRPSCASEIEIFN